DRENATANSIKKATEREVRVQGRITAAQLAGAPKADAKPAAEMVPPTVGKPSKKNKSAAAALKAQLLGKKRERDDEEEEDGDATVKEEKMDGEETTTVEEFDPAGAVVAAQATEAPLVNARVTGHADAEARRSEFDPAEAAVEFDPAEAAVAAEAAEAFLEQLKDSMDKQATVLCEQAAEAFLEQLKDSMDKQATVLCEQLDEVKLGETGWKDRYYTGKFGVDEVKLGETGWKDRYYTGKFGVDLKEDPEFARKVVQSFMEGICWTLAYYYRGCPSWDWYYPYHYAPFASDFVGLG
ncbi:hypothetical protein T484DRAFT_1840329, partial [Baffinella frigidus]